MRYSKSFLVFLLCGDLPTSVAKTESILSGRQFSLLCRVLAASGHVLTDLWHNDALDYTTLAGDAICRRVKQRLGNANAAWQEWERLQAHGISVCTFADEQYPLRLRDALQTQAPLVLYMAGSYDLLQRTAIGAVGSRDADEQSRRFAAKLGEVCAKESLAVISGGAVGVDTEAVSSALAHGGTAMICCADRLARQYGEAILADPEVKTRALWISAAHPDAAFAAYRALERNRFIYSLAKYTVVVSADANGGGTWSGATDSLRHNWSPLFVRQGDAIRDGNRLLLSRADIAGIDWEDLCCRQDQSLLEWMQSHHPLTQYEQLQLF